MKTDCRSGFVLIEILTVMAVISILASIAIPRYSTYLHKTQAASCQSNRRNIELEFRAKGLENSVSRTEYTKHRDWHKKSENLGQFLFYLIHLGISETVDDAWAGKPPKDKKPKKPKKNEKPADNENATVDEDMEDLQITSDLPDINDNWKCPSGGLYLWLSADPDNPKVACSKHYVGQN